MARLISTVNIDPQVHERWSNLRNHVSVLLRYNEHSIGLGAMLGLLMDHWENTPPSLDWLKVQAERYPKRGRPRKSAPASMDPVVAMRKKTLKGHDVFCKRKNPGKMYCKKCTLIWDFRADNTPPYDCPTISSLSMCNWKTWTKSELRELNFEEDEIQWAAE